MLAQVTMLRLRPFPPQRIAGTVTDTQLRPLSRLVQLYNQSRQLVAEIESDADGYAEFMLTGVNANDRFIVRAVGLAAECDDISCPIRAEALS